MKTTTIAARLRGLSPARLAEVIDFIDFLRQRESLPAKGDANTKWEGLTEGEAADLRQRLSAFTDWDSPEMDVYDNYDTHKAALDTDA